jgi:hypothetical protein
MNKTIIFILILMFFPKLVSAGCEQGELRGVVGVGFSNPDYPIDTTNWLFQTIPNQNLTDNSAIGFDCDFNIVINSRAGLENDSAYYTIQHDDPDEIRFRFILDTENLLASFGDGNDMVLYKFEALDRLGELSRFLKVRLIKRKVVNSFNHYYWEMVFQWFYDNGENSRNHQKLYFYEDDESVEFEFFWNKIDMYLNGGGPYLYTKSRAGMLVTIGERHKSTMMISPYSYENLLNSVIYNLEGASSLGYININNNPAGEGDEIRLLSPIKYEE